MPASKRKLIIAGIVLVGVALTASVIFVSSHHFSKVALDGNGDGREDVIVEPYAIEGDGDGDGGSATLEESDVAPEVSFEERKAIVEGDAYKDVVGHAEWINEKCFFDEEGGFWFMPYDVPIRQYDAQEVNEIGKEVIINDAIEAYGQIESDAE